ncbi:MAG: hypothetical protein JWN92_1875 [Candidatus Acidoferrum typicum]|nr:hypothetical protein [Candidatus Acidoferrum typicum]
MACLPFAIRGPGDHFHDRRLRPAFVRTDRLGVELHENAGGGVAHQLLHDFDVFAVAFEQRGEGPSEGMPADVLGDAHVEVTEFAPEGVVFTPGKAM